MAEQKRVRGVRVWVAASAAAFVVLGFADLLTPGFAGDDSLWAVVRLWVVSGTPRYGYGVWEAAVPVMVRAAWIITPAVVLGWAVQRAARRPAPAAVRPA